MTPPSHARAVVGDRPDGPLPAAQETPLPRGSRTTADGATVLRLAPLPESETRQRVVDQALVNADSQADRLDRITRLARRVLDVPMSSINLVDHDTVLLASEQGVGFSRVPLRAVPCERTVAEDRLLVVPDLAADPRFAELPGVVSGQVRFYAGHPLRDRRGTVVGTFCVFDAEPRSLDDDALQTFADMASWAQQDLLASDEMREAARIQAALLPEAPPALEGWRVLGRCIPALAIGGDFYDHELSDGVLHAGLGDVMGMGTGAAFVGAGVRAALRAGHPDVVRGEDLGAVTGRVADSLRADLERAESFVTGFWVAVDVTTGATRWVDAGMGLCVLRRADGTAEQLHSGDLPLGLWLADRWDEHRLDLGPGDRLVLFSDGLLDLVDDAVDWLPEVAALVDAAATPEELLDAVQHLTTVREATDDVTVLAIFRDEAPPEVGEEAGS